MISVLFSILSLTIPLYFFKNTSELFEFNKVIALYGFTTLIISAWAVESIKKRKVIFNHSILDWPLIIYLIIYLFSTILSIDPRSSVLGYYSRFNGGLITQICYALLYWAFVSNIKNKEAIKITIYGLVGTAVASLLAIGEHFGLFATCGMMKLGWNQSCWVQDVQNRVFSTLGQPNWLAALVVAVLPLSWYQFMTSASKANDIPGFNSLNSAINSLPYLLLSVLLFLALVFTKSRSGLLAFGVESVIFWGFVFFKDKAKYVKEFLLLNFIFVLFYFIFASPFKTPNLQPEVVTGPVLESGGTESGTIRKYVWIGAINVFKHFPILGSGPETFAFSYPMFKPVGHNLTSEWDFVYNKAHNEFLNYLATTGVIGFISYLSLISFSIFIIFKSKRFDYLAAYVSILVTNFFGFLVVPVSLLFFLLPALAVINKEETTKENQTKKLGNKEWLSILVVVLIAGYVLNLIYKYWQADISFNSAKNLNRSNKPDAAIVEINKALAFEPNEPIFIYELALADGTVETANNALSLSPFNQNLRKILISNLVKNVDTNPENMLLAEDVVKDGIDISPRDPRLYYQLGILNLKNNKIEEGIKNFEKSVELKANYKEARFALGLTYIDVKNFEKAKENLDYILKYIDPNDELTKKYLNKLNEPQ